MESRSKVKGLKGIDGYGMASICAIYLCKDVVKVNFFWDIPE
jgi:hypothetical protein